MISKKTFTRILIGGVSILTLLFIAQNFVGSYPIDAGSTGASNLRGEEGSGRVEESASGSTYTNERYGFTFEYPKGYSVGQFTEEGGEVIVVQPEANSQSRENGFQIYASQVSDPISLTPDFITSDLPGITVNDPKKIMLDGAEGIMFKSNAASFGDKSFELWFYHEGFVYQVTGYQEAEQFISSVIGTWRWIK